MMIILLLVSNICLLVAWLIEYDNHKLTKFTLEVWKDSNNFWKNEWFSLFAKHKESKRERISINVKAEEC